LSENRVFPFSRQVVPEVETFQGFQSNVFPEVPKPKEPQIPLLIEPLLPESDKRPWEDTDVYEEEAEPAETPEEQMRREAEEYLSQARETLEAAREEARQLGDAAQAELDFARAQAAQIQTEADHALEQARRQAEEMVARAQVRTDEIEAKAYQAGFEQGEEAGRRLNEQKIESVMRRLEGILEQVTTQCDRLVDEREEELVKLAYLISLQLIHREIQQSPEVVLDVVRAGITRLKRAQRLTIFISPHDFSFIENHLDVIQGWTETGTRITVEPQETVGRGGCLIHSNAGEVDATIATMVRHMFERIWGEETAAGLLDTEPEIPSPPTE
jgi:flagellar assembly protein FliH